MKTNKIFWLLGFLFVCYAIAFLGSFATNESLYPWYANLQKGSWNPPAWVFAPVWMVLYFMIALSGWLIFIQKKSNLRSFSLYYYSLQLLFNFLWSFLFFYFQNPLLSLFDIFLLLIFIALTIKTAWPISKWASYLLIPYFLWTLYASSLNGAIFYLN